MPTKLQRIEADALKLDLKSRTELVRKLELSLKSEASSRSSSEIEAERLWIQEAMKRSREIRERSAGSSPPAASSPAARPVPIQAERGPAKRPKRRPARKPSAKRRRARR
jgi:hypothetical protein